MPKLTSEKFGIGRHLDAPARRAFLGGFRERAARHRFHDMMSAVRDETDYLAQVEEALSSTLSEKPALTIYGEKNDPFGFQEKFAEYFTDVAEMVIPGGNIFRWPMTPEGSRKESPRGVAAGGIDLTTGTTDPESRGAYEIAPGQTPQRIPGTEAMTFPSDVTLDETGDIYATDTVAGTVWRIPRDGATDLWAG